MSGMVRTQAGLVSHEEFGDWLKKVPAIRVRVRVRRGVRRLAEEGASEG